MGSDPREGREGGRESSDGPAWAPIGRGAGGWIEERAWGFAGLAVGARWMEIAWRAQFFFTDGFAQTAAVKNS